MNKQKKEYEEDAHNSLDQHQNKLLEEKKRFDLQLRQVKEEYERQLKQQKDKYQQKLLEREKDFELVSEKM